MLAYMTKKNEDQELNSFASFCDEMQMQMRGPAHINQMGTWLMEDEINHLGFLSCYNRKKMKQRMERNVPMVTRDTGYFILLGMRQKTKR